MDPPSGLAVLALAGLPEVRAGDDLGALVARHSELRDGDVVVVAHKAVSKVEGRVRRLAEVEPTPRAIELAALGGGRDPRHVQVVLDESGQIVRVSPTGTLICATRHGYVCANAGVDASNATEPGTLILLPLDPDASARQLRRRLRELTGALLAVVVTDSFGRAWRVGQCDVAIGIAGLAPVEDWRGRVDAAGRPLTATLIAVADELAGAADLVRGKDEGVPVVIVRGLARHVGEEDGPGAAALVRERADDLFR